MSGPRRARSLWKVGSADPRARARPARCCRRLRARGVGGPDAGGAGVRSRGVHEPGQDLPAAGLHGRGRALRGDAVRAASGAPCAPGARRYGRRRWHTHHVGKPRYAAYAGGRPDGALGGAPGRRRALRAQLPRGGREGPGIRRGAARDGTARTGAGRRPRGGGAGRRSGEEVANPSGRLHPSRARSRFPSRRSTGCRLACPRERRASARPSSRSAPRPSAATSSTRWRSRS
jgi:hypothetical protein